MLWTVPPVVLLAGSLAVARQLRRIAAERTGLSDAHRTLEEELDRAGLTAVRRAVLTARASLDDLERR